MVKPILFRGGTYGDLLLGMLDPNALINTNNFKLDYPHSTCADKYIKYTRTFMKKFLRYTDAQKEKYYRKLDCWVLTHDTAFSTKHRHNTVQLICTDLDLLPIFAKRFYNIHDEHVITETKTMIQNEVEFIDDYSKSLKNWQEKTAMFFQKRFDIKNIYNKENFLEDVAKFFEIGDTAHMEKIYTRHFQIQTQ